MTATLASKSEYSGQNDNQGRLTVHRLLTTLVIWMINATLSMEYSHEDFHSVKGTFEKCMLIVRLQVQQLL